MGSYNRRNGARIPLQIFLNEYVKDEPRRSMTFNISETGLYVNRLANSEAEPDSRVVGLEFELPGTAETIWARGEVVYDCTDELFHGTGIRFAGMARMHERIVRDFVLEEQAQKLKELLGRIRRNRHVVLN